MTLDLPTLMVMQSFAMACAGAALVFAWLQNRAVFALAIWGMADLLAAAGIVSLMFGATLQRPVWSVVGGVLLCSQSSLIWKAVRNIDGKRAPLVAVLIGPVAIIATAFVPVVRDVNQTFAVAGGAVYIFAAAVSLWLGRGDRLIARCTLIAFAAVHALSLSVGIYSTLNGSTGLDAVPALGSLFGFIYFESIVFALGTAVFALALIKERSEAASLAAARTDGLTGIANRVALLAGAKRALHRCRRASAPIATVMFDLDRFKNINDRYGHAVGDAVIKKFCTVTAAVLRPHDLFGRIGGEEFVVVMPDTNMEIAARIAERVRAEIEQERFIVDEHSASIGITVSIGLAERGTDDLPDGLFRRADRALYRSKTNGRNRVSADAA